MPNRDGQRSKRRNGLLRAVVVMALIAVSMLVLLALPRNPINPDTQKADPREGHRFPQPPAMRELPTGGDSFTFVVLSDRTGGHVPGKWGEAIEHVNRLAPEFVMTVGDFIEGYTSDEAELRRQWDEFDEITAGLKPPVYYCPGNHDVVGEPARREYIKRHGTGGRARFSIDRHGYHFVVIDATTLPGREHSDHAELTADEHGVRTEDTLTWLAADLAAARHARHVFVFCHYPLYAEPSWPRVRKMMDPARTTIFGGHWHAASHTVAQGFECYVLPATAAHGPNDNFAEGKFNGFARVTVPASPAAGDGGRSAGSERGPPRTAPVRPKIDLIPVGGDEPVPFPEIELPADYFTPAAVPPRGG